MVVMIFPQGLGEVLKLDGKTGRHPPAFLFGISGLSASWSVQKVPGIGYNPFPKLKSGGCFEK